MPVNVVMPALEMAQETGKLISWLKKEGDTVAKGEPLLEIETDKAVMELESPGDGVLTSIKAQPGAEVPVGQTIAWIVRPGESVPAEEVSVQTGRTSSAPVSAPAGLQSPAPVSAQRDIRISPKARRLAAERGVDLSRLRGSGPGGEILAADIPAAATSVSAPRSELTPVARLMAERTTQSWTTVPHFFLTRDVDATALMQAREKLAPAVEQKRGVKLTYTDLLVAIVARVLLKHPKLNASWTAERVQINATVNMSIAVAVEDGVVAPVIHDAANAELAEIAAQRHSLAQRARAAKLRPPDITGGTFTISNLGMFGVDAFSAIITPPQAAILAVGRIAERVVPLDGIPAIRPMMTLTLSSDHRVADGATAAAFLHAVAAASQKEWLLR